MGNESQVIARKKSASGVGYTISIVLCTGIVSLSLFFIAAFFLLRGQTPPADSGEEILGFVVAIALIGYFGILGCIIGIALLVIFVPLLILSIVNLVRYCKMPNAIIRLEGDMLILPRHILPLKEFSRSVPLKRGSANFELNGEEYRFRFIADEKQTAKRLEELRTRGASFTAEQL